MKDKTTIIEAFELLRFPLIACVVLIHCNLSEVTLQGVDITSTYPSWYHSFMYFFSEALTRLAVPVFFIISGYLFFYNITDFNGKVYIGKLKRRTRSLLIPYLIWNVIAILVTLIKANMPSMFPSLAKENHDLLWFICSFWSLDEGRCPILYPLWYVRDLMVVILFSPIIYAMIKYLKQWALVILLVLWYFPITTMPTGLGTCGFCFFPIGAYWSINGATICKALNNRLLLPPPIICPICNIRY